MIERNDAIRNVFLQAVTSQRTFTALAGHDDRDSFFLEPAKEPVERFPHDRMIGQSREEALDRVQHNALRLDAVNGVAKPEEETLEIVFAGLLELVALDLN